MIILSNSRIITIGIVVWKLDTSSGVHPINRLMGNFVLLDGCIFMTGLTIMGFIFDDNY